MAESRKAIQKRADDKEQEQGESLDVFSLSGQCCGRMAKVLRELLVECLISPLHDKDVWTEADELENPEHKAGTPKKAHWHVVLSFKNQPQTKKHKIFNAINGVGCKKFQTLSKWQGIFAIWINLKNIAI